MHENSKQLFLKYALQYFTSPADRVLEVGPDPGRMYLALLQSTYRDCSVWDTVDVIPDSKPTFVAENPYVFPIPDNSYNIVLSGQVIEHVARPWLWVPELRRVCRHGGYVITINPVSWEYHPDPLDCWRIFPDGMRVLYEDAGLRVDLSMCESLDGESTDTLTIGSK